MIWTAPEVRRPGGSMVAPEPVLLRELLDFHRATLLHKCAGLTGAQLAGTPVAGADLSLLGLLRHLAKVERIWFRIRLAGEAVPMLHSTPQDPDADFTGGTAKGAEADYARLLAEQELARRAADGADLDATVLDRDGEVMSVRMVLVHMIGEYARHNGHADLLRQSIDGVTGA
jgi:uncharacterized damage-inducible protein DinB